MHNKTLNTIIFFKCPCENVLLAGELIFTLWLFVNILCTIPWDICILNKTTNIQISHGTKKVANM